VTTTWCGSANASAGGEVVRQEWLRAGDRTPACWACFLVYDDRVEVLAVIGPKEHVDRSMPRDAARKLWNELRERGWYRVSDDELNEHQMSHRELRRIAYGPR
jgi:hypothetical protein